MLPAWLVVPNTDTQRQGEGAMRRPHVALLVAFGSAGGTLADPRPNIIQIMVSPPAGSVRSPTTTATPPPLPELLLRQADDMGQWAMGAYGNKVIHTPTLDRLAAEGTLFEQAFCNTPVCSASRTSYLTGRLPSQHGVHDWIAGGNGNAPNVVIYPETEACGEGINYTASETTYSDVLKSQGYHLGFTGKIHIGNQPFAQHGFDHWFVHQSGGGDYNNPPFVVNGTVEAAGKCTLIPGYISDIIATDVVEQVNTHAADAKPWYMAMHFTAPHAPYTGPGGLARTMHPAKFTELYDHISESSDPLPNQDVAKWQAYASGTCTDWTPKTLNGTLTSTRKEYIKGDCAKSPTFPLSLADDPDFLSLCHRVLRRRVSHGRQYRAGGGGCGNRWAHHEDALHLHLGPRLQRRTSRAVW